MAQGQVDIDVDRCKGCGLCVHVCPQKILVLTQDRFNTKGYHPIMVSNPDRCVGCGSCAMICPDTVFTVYRTVQQRAFVGAAGG